ncbi:hypothetical protein BVC80_1707g111 [Macleaya cordata]|uniref:Uncharacterized protein n=1 Tax=Macleaya cordata TaxID=56857 RepID=A0A200Q690_MACCD|nr:hypothetical protein BVC80_1707g111 [Macleaya cordata]
MAGSTRFELASGNNEGSAFPATYPNGQRGNYSGANLDRSGSFRDGIENRLLGSGPGSSRGNTPLSAEVPHLSQFLTLELITMGDQKFTRSGELRRVLGVSLGSTSEDHFGAAHSKTPPIASEELKRFKASVLDTSNKARDRVKKFTDSIVKLEKYRIISRKRRTESSERSGGGGMLKMGNQIHQNPPDIVNQKMEERTKNVLNKRVRTSIAEVRSEGRATGPLRQPVALDKERDMFRAGSGTSVQGDEKIRGLPAGGEGWDKKMKRKRSVGAVVTRAMDVDRELKRVMHQKLPNDPRSRSCDTHSFGSGSSNGIAGTNKLDGTSQPTSASARAVPRNEPDNVSLPNDRRERMTGLDKERAVTKGNSKPSVREDNQVGSASPVTKGKASRAPRTGSSVVHSSTNFLRAPGALDGWEQQPPSLNKVQAVSGPNNRKRPLPTGSSSPSMAQWASQRAQKISRTRRANLVSPVPNHDEAQISPDGFPVADIGGRLTSNEANGSLLPRGVSHNTQQLKMKLENVPSPARLSESEESGAGENKLKEKGIDNDEIEDKAVNALQKVGSLIPPTKKNKMLINEEIGDGVRRQGRSGRGSSLSRASAPPLREKLENPAIAKPLQSTRLGSDKNESKSGRPPSKKLSERKAFTRAVHVPNGVSSDFTGESDDDHEELLAAATSVHTSKYLACTGSFWKKMEPIFASVSSDNAAYLKQQLFFVEVLDESLNHVFDADNNVLGELVPDEVASSQPSVSRERQGIQSNGIGSSDSARCVGLVDQLQCVDTLSGKFQTERKFEMVTPLYERVLSALIGEDEMEEFDHSRERRNSSFLYVSDGSPSTNGDRVESEIESEVDFRPQKPCLLDSFSCDGSTASNSFRSSSIRNSSYNDELCQGNDSLVHSEFGAISRYGQSNLDGSQPLHTDVSGISSVECQYEQMSLDDKLLLELHSIGLYPETVPDLAEGEEQDIDKDILALKRNLYQQVGAKKGQLLKIDKAIQKGREVEGRDLEQDAMNKLVEMAYKKQMACRGSSASKSGVIKVSKQAALAFVKRTIARCRKFEDTGRSCFSEPALRDVIFSGLSGRNDAKSVDTVGAVATSIEAHASQPESRASVVGALPTLIGRHGPHGDKLDRGSLDAFQTLTHSSDQVFPKHEAISNRGKKKEVLLDDVAGSAASRSTSALGNSLLGGAKGRRSERDRDQNKSVLTRNSVPKAGRPALGSYRGERKTKTKPKQKTAQLSTSGNGLLGRVTETTCPVYPSVRGSNEVVNNGSGKISREQGLLSPGNIPQDSSKETEEPLDFSNLPLHEIDSIEELGVSNNLGAPQDLSSWLNFDEDGLQDHDSMGLEIPMDDLSDLNMLI